MANYVGYISKRLFSLEKCQCQNIVKRFSTKPSKNTKTTCPRITVILAAIGGGSGLYYTTLQESEKRKLRVAVGGVSRFFRSLSIGMQITFDYWWNLRGLAENSVEYEKEIKKIHKRAAELMKEGCLKNRGLYIKLGQGLVSLNHILPEEYLETLKVLQDKCLTAHGDDVEKLFKEEFGKSHKELFKEFGETPIAAASLAQVYKAKTLDGKDIAVKIQYIDLKDRFFGDVMTIQFLLKIAAIVHPNFDFQWVLNELRETLEQELDFLNEAKNSEKCASHLKHLKFVYVPKVYWELSTERILTTEFINGIKISDQSGLKSLNLSLADIDRKLICAFGEQIFHTGFVHADPHPGNVLVRKNKDGDAELVILDHGLYQVLPSEERKNLCNLWKSIVLHDESEMKKYSAALGVEDPFLFAEILMQRPLKLHRYKLKITLNEEDMKYMKYMAKQRFDKIILALRQMPKNMLLVIRNMNTIRAITKDHGDPIDRYTLMARSATKGFFSGKELSFNEKISYYKQKIYFELYLLADYLKFIAYSTLYKVFRYFKLVPEIPEFTQ